MLIFDCMGHDHRDQLRGFPGSDCLLSAVSKKESFLKLWSNLPLWPPRFILLCCCSVVSLKMAAGIHGVIWSITWLGWKLSLNNNKEIFLVGSASWSASQTQACKCLPWEQLEIHNEGKTEDCFKLRYYICDFRKMNFIPV